MTGSSSGIGEQLAQILYQKNAKVYVAARSEEKARKAIEGIKAKAPNSKGEVRFLHLDLDDLTTIKASAEAFLSENDRLDVLWNNAGVMVPPQGSKTKQGYEKQIGTNNVAPFLFTKLLLPILTETARKAPSDSVRVVWVSSSAAEMSSPKGGVDLGNLDYKVDKGIWVKYGVSKAGNVLHAGELAKRAGPDGIISVVRSHEFGCGKYRKLTVATELKSRQSPKRSTANHAKMAVLCGCKRSPFHLIPSHQSLHCGPYTIMI